MESRASAYPIHSAFLLQVEDFLTHISPESYQQLFVCSDRSIHIRMLKMQDIEDETELGRRKEDGKEDRTGLKVVMIISI